MKNLIKGVSKIIQNEAKEQKKKKRISWKQVKEQLEKVNKLLEQVRIFNAAFILIFLKPVSMLFIQEMINLK